MTESTGPVPIKMERVRLTLSANEFSQLVAVCEEELRGVPDQIRHIVQAYLKRRQAPSSWVPCQRLTIGHCPDYCYCTDCPPHITDVTEKDVAAAKAYTCQCGETDPDKIVPARANGPSSAPYAIGNDTFLYCDTCHVWAACSVYLWDAYVLRKEAHD